MKLYAYFIFKTKVFATKEIKHKRRGKSKNEWHKQGIKYKNNFVPRFVKRVSRVLSFLFSNVVHMKLVLYVVFVTNLCSEFQNCVHMEHKLTHTQSKAKEKICLHNAIIKAHIKNA